MTSITKTIAHPALGERALAVHPTITPGGDAADFAAQGWGRRTRYVAGRSVTDRAFQTDQRHTGGHMATAGQRLAPGVIVGLEVEVEGPREDPVLHIAPGMGVCASGEDVRVAHALQLAAESLWVVAAAPGDPPRRLSELLGDGLAQARALVVQLRPVEVERTGVDDPDDPCEIDPEAIAFTDEQLVDGCRVRLHALEIPPGATPATFRNDIAYAIFELEAAADAALLPWQSGGLPIAVLGFAPGAATPAFVDVHAAAREGGHASPRRSLRTGTGHRQLWQARFEQFIDQIADADIEALQVAGLGSEFRRLPPVGMLPAASMDVRGDVGEPDFPLPAPPIFPPQFVVEALPVEMEGLDEYLHAGAGLAAFDTLDAEQVQVLVPVPQAHFDPDLLVVEDETPDEFRETIERLLLVTNHRLGRRFDLRSAQRLLQQAVSGKEPEFPSEPSAVEGEVSAFFPVDGVLEAAGLPVPAPESVRGDSIRPVVRTLVTAMYEAVGGVGKVGNVNPIAAVMVAAQRHFGLATIGIPLGQNTPAELYDLLVAQRFGGRGIVGLANFMLEGLVSASERMTLAFERLQSELHRVREYVSDRPTVNQLASSPVLSAIAVRDNSAKAPLQLQTFASNLRLASTRPIDPPQGIKRLTAKVPTAGIATGGRPIASSILFGQNLLERIDTSPPAFDASANADRATREALRTILYLHDDLGLSLDGIAFPERLLNREAIEPPLPAGAPFTITVIRQEIRRWLAEGTWNHEFDEDGDNRTEADFFGNAVRRLEEMVAVLRIAEARLTAFEAVVDLMRDAVGELDATHSSITGRLAELTEEIEELRHDITVARALEREEVARAERINRLRRQVIAEHVPFLLFRRPRSVEALRVPPTAVVEAAERSEVVPDCLDDSVVPPEQLDLMIDLIRELPVDRLVIGPKVLRSLDKRAPLLAVAEWAAQMTSAPREPRREPFAGPLFDDRIGRALRRRHAVHRVALDASRVERSRAFASPAYRNFAWSRLRTWLSANATVGDILASGHGRWRHVQALAGELEDITRVATCLYESFKKVAPIVRFAWVEVLSQEDEVVPRLDDLSLLPRWAEVDRLHRNDLQALNAWLFARFDVDHDDGIAYVSDLVRVCILTSSHAPVQQVLDAAVVSPAPVRAGGVLHLQLDPARVRVGMQVALYADTARRVAVGSGVVEDLADGVVAVAVVGTTDAKAVVATHALVAEAAASTRVALAGGRQADFGFTGGVS